MYVLNLAKVWRLYNLVILFQMSAKPALRGLLKNQLKKDFTIAAVLAFATTASWQLLVKGPRKSHYTEFYKSVTMFSLYIYYILTIYYNMLNQPFTNATKNILLLFLITLYSKKRLYLVSCFHIMIIWRWVLWLGSVTNTYLFLVGYTMQNRTLREWRLQESSQPSSQMGL